MDVLAKVNNPERGKVYYPGEEFILIKKKERSVKNEY